MLHVWNIYRVYIWLKLNGWKWWFPTIFPKYSIGSLSNWKLPSLFVLGYQDVTKIENDKSLKEENQQKYTKNQETHFKIHPGRLAWNIVMEAWKIMFLSKWVICRFHVNLPGYKTFQVTKHWKHLVGFAWLFGTKLASSVGLVWHFGNLRCWGTIGGISNNLAWWNIQIWPIYDLFVYKTPPENEHIMISLKADKD